MWQDLTLRQCRDQQAADSTTKERRMTSVARVAIFAVAGTAATIVASLIAFALSSTTSFDLYSLFIRHIIPVGAMAFGVIGALGYFLAGLNLGLRPSRWMAVYVLFAALAAHLLFYYLQYMTARAFGTHLSQLISFTRF